jgi:hypothetical protein
LKPGSTTKLQSLGKLLLLYGSRKLGEGIFKERRVKPVAPKPPTKKKEEKIDCGSDYERRRLSAALYI